MTPTETLEKLRGFDRQIIHGPREFREMADTVDAMINALTPFAAAAEKADAESAQHKLLLGTEVSPYASPGWGIQRQHLDAARSVLGHNDEAHRQPPMKTLESKTDAEAAVRCSDWLAPFVAVAKGIPDNWPGECILRFDQRNDGSIYLSYHGINDASDGITIRQWRALLGANKQITHPYQGSDLSTNDTTSSK